MRSKKTSRTHPTARLALAVGLLAWGPLVLPTAHAEASPSHPVREFTVADTDYDTVKFLLTEAIRNKGLLISGTLHVQEMLERTAADLGYPPSPYRQAESLEFCSADLSHKMIAVHPANLTVCPFTIALYTLQGDEATVYVAYEVPRLSGSGEEVEGHISALLDGIIEEVTD